MKEYQARAPNGKVINAMLVIKPGANRNPAPQLPALHLNEEFYTFLFSSPYGPDILYLLVISRGLRNISPM